MSLFVRFVALAIVIASYLTGCKPGTLVNKPSDTDTVATEPRSSNRLAEINTQLGVEYMKDGN